MSKFPNSYYYFTIFLEYDFERLNNTECPYENETFETLAAAQNNCKGKRQCNGVLNVECNAQNKYRICLKNVTTTTHHTINSCFYRKTIMGKQAHSVSVNSNISFTDSNVE